MQVLIVTPDRAFAEAAADQLPKGGQFSISIANTVGEAMAIATDGTEIDCIVSDHDFPKTDGIAFLEAIRATSPSLPFILFTSEGDEQIASRAITAGVTDYLIKERQADQWDQLSSLISDAVQYSRTRQELPFEDSAKTLLDNSYDLIAIAKEGSCEYINETGVNILGAPAKTDLINEPIEDWVVMDGDLHVSDLLATVEGEAGAIDHREATLKREHIERIPVQLTVTSVRWATGPAVVLIARDLRKRKALKSDLELKERAMDEAPIGVTITDATKPEHPLIYVNDKLQDMTGYSADEFLGRNCRFLQGPKTEAEPVAEMQAAIEEEKPVTVELRNYRKDGSWFWNRVSIAPVRDDEGTVTHYVGFQQDVTAEKQHERKLNRFMEAVEAAGHAIYMTDADGEIFYVNPAFERITGYEASEALGENPRILKSGEMSDAYYQELWAQVTSGDIWREVVINRRKNGEPYHAEQTIAPITGPDGEITAYVAIQTDITERERMRKRSEIALEETQSLIFEIDTETGERSRHGAIEQFFDVDATQISSQTAFQDTVVYQADRERFEAFIDRLASGDKDYDMLDFRMQTANGEIRWLRSHAYRDSDRRIIGLARDITDQKQREEALQHYKQAVESSNDLLAAVDKDLNYLFANHTYCRYHGIGNVDITEYTLPEVLGEEAFASVRPKVAQAQEGEPVQMEITRTHPEKGERILDVRLFPLEGPNGEIHGNGAAMRDITADRERQVEIERESELRRLMSEVNHSLVRSTNIGEALSEVTTVIGDASEFTCTFSYVLDEGDSKLVCGGHSDLSESEIDSIHSEAYIDAVFDAGVLHIEDVTEGRFAHHDSEMASHHGLGIALSHDDERYGVLTVHFPPGKRPRPKDRDVLETIAEDISYFISNRMLRSEYKSFTEIVERIDDPVMLQDREGSFTLVNEAVAEFAGLDKASLLGADETAFMDAASAERIEEMKHRVLESEDPLSYQIEPTFPNGRERTFSTTRYPYYDEQGHLAGTIAICRDVTDLQEHQRQLRVLDRVLRHNVNNNMNVVQGYAEMIRAEAAGPLAGYAEKIEENSNHLLDIAHKQRKITEFLSDSDPVERFDLAPVIDQLVDRVEQANPHATMSVTRPDQVEVRALKAIEEAIEELLTNSIIHAETEPAPELHVEPHDHTVRIRVSDTNDQMAKMDRDVFAGRNELSTLRHGSGLGLWLVKLIVDHSNGQVSYATNEPRGNIVTIELKRP